ncbi:uncharacterized protein E0L32_006212 [Thyridium curvatum]|uniref:Uncharacterized protein n=1 Tax=Thyridium curvatum TaxID=1093900 RepID=A0A507AU20_9PEZI|nr:uncharacterized protein E0L32_006212 [Thyridium curvatum]TPX13482.1 hypothetical protein E0L32_006212 [Thyridium curvatum]
MDDLPLQDTSFSPLAHTINGMKRTSHHEWGFVIYRCAYGDDAAWQRYLDLLKASVAETLDILGRDVLLGPILVWTVVEDQGLDQATPEDVRSRFRVWASEKLAVLEKDIQLDLSQLPPGAKVLSLPRHLPRFQFCVGVDAACLEPLVSNTSSSGALNMLLVNGQDENSDPGTRGPASTTDSNYMKLPARSFCTAYEEAARDMSWIMLCDNLPFMYNN